MNQTIEAGQNLVNANPDIAQNTANAMQTGGTWGMIIYCLFIVVILYLFMIRPNKKRMAEYQKMIDSIKVGNRILAAGIYGTVKKVNEKTVDVEIAKGVVVEISKNAIANVE
jgi:preprotein translocase subunit YajC